eukprot:1056189-Amphidinium_carterae.3
MPGPMGAPGGAPLLGPGMDVGAELGPCIAGGTPPVQHLADNAALLESALARIAELEQKSHRLNPSNHLQQDLTHCQKATTGEAKASSRRWRHV